MQEVHSIYIDGGLSYIGHTSGSQNLLARHDNLTLDGKRQAVAIDVGLKCRADMCKQFRTLCLILLRQQACQWGRNDIGAHKFFGRGIA